MKANRKFIENEEAVLSYFIVFIFSAVMLVFLFSFAIPFLVDFSTDIYLAGDSILADAESKIDSITNATIKAQIQGNIDNMQAATAENIEYLSVFYKYSWILIIVIVTFTIFIIARQTVETKGYSGVV